MADRMKLQCLYMQHKSKVHNITILEAVELYADQFAKLWILIETN